MNNLNEIIQEISIKFNGEIDACVKTLLNSIKVKYTKNMTPKDLQIKLLEKQYDIVQYAFDTDPFKRFVCLTDYKNKFIKGYLISYDIKSNQTTKQLIKTKQEYEQIIKNI